MREFYGDVELELLRRVRLVYRRPVDDSHRLAELQKVRLTIQHRKTCFTECRKEWGRATVEDRWLRSIHVDRHIVDAHPRHRSENMLDRVNSVIALAQMRPSLAGADLTDVRADARRSRAIGATKDDTLLICHGLERDSTRHAQMQADALERRRPG